MAFDLEAIRKKVAQLQGVYNSRVQLWKPALGNHRIRVLPWPDATSESPIKELYFYYLGDSGAILAPFQFGKPDPINALMKHLFSTKIEEDKIIAKTLRPAMRAYVPIIDRANEAQGPIVWAFGKTAYERMLGFYLDEDTQDWTSPGADGWDLKVEVVPNKGKSSFSKTLIGQIDTAKKPSILHADPEVVKKWMSSIPNIKDMYTLKSESEMTEALEKFINSGAGIVDSQETEQGRNEQTSEETETAALPAAATEEEKQPEKAKRVARKTSTTVVEAQLVPEATSAFDNLDKAFDSLMTDE
jgi:hypothetical protein